MAVIEHSEAIRRIDQAGISGLLRYVYALWVLATTDLLFA
jgi:hypothetical protein